VLVLLFGVVVGSESLGGSSLDARLFSGYEAILGCSSLCGAAEVPRG
jgi:hypothetical protein